MLFCIINNHKYVEMVQNRLQLVRQWLADNDFDAIVIPSSDPHMSEYVADRWKTREWVSGFDGSAGTVVVTKSDAGLWTDSRYFLQAEIQLKDSGIKLFRQGLPDVPDMVEWLGDVLENGGNVAIDSSLFSINGTESLRQGFSEKGLNLFLLDNDPFDAIWEGRPSLPGNPVNVYSVDYAGEGACSKIIRIREEIMKTGAECLFVSMLDEIAWILNLRGSDIDYNPVFVSYLLVSQDKVRLFVEPEKIPCETKRYLDEINVEVHGYEDVKNLSGEMKDVSVLVDPARNSAFVGRIFSESEIVYAVSPVVMMKALRNPVEIDGLRNAMVKDGVALVRFGMWLEKAVAGGHETEYTIGEKLREFRKEQNLFVEESFAPIVGFRSNGAIVHYEASESGAANVSGSGLLLIDSGAQFLDGTTDITRTFAFGEISEEEKADYTLVLKGNIQLAMACFPEGTRGTQLDVLARAAMWKSGINYLHGTGHGVGHFLNVHEGPQAIRMNDVPVALREGMLVSDEPGIYKSGRHGVRLENLLLVRKMKEGEFGRFYSFETVTLFPFDRKAILASMLTAEEAEWLDGYHKSVYDRLSPYLTEEERNWLMDKTMVIQ